MLSAQTISPIKTILFSFISYLLFVLSVGKDTKKKRKSEGKAQKSHPFGIIPSHLSKHVGANVESVLEGWA
jgi:hypothetical protein